MYYQNKITDSRQCYKTYTLAASQQNNTMYNFIIFNYSCIAVRVHIRQLVFFRADEKSGVTKYSVRVDDAPAEMLPIFD